MKLLILGATGATGRQPVSQALDAGHAFFASPLMISKADTLSQRSPIEWTIVRPVARANGPRTGKYRVGEHLDLRGFPSVSRADVADFMLRELAESAWMRKSVVIST